MMRVSREYGEGIVRVSRGELEGMVRHGMW